MIKNLKNNYYKMNNYLYKEKKLKNYENFCSEKYNFYKNILNSKKISCDMILPLETSYSTYSLLITPDKNKCYQKSNNEKCKILLVMKCFKNDDYYCSYKILVSIS